MVFGRSIRARMTIATVVVFGAVVLLGVLTISLGYPMRARADLVQRVDDASRNLALTITEHRFNGPIPPRKNVYLLQIVNSDGHVLAASAELAGRPPLTRAWPRKGDFRVETRVCPGRCMIVVGMSSPASAYGSVVAYAALREPFLLHAPFLPLMLAAFGAVLVALVGWGAWYGVGRVLAPVERIRVGLDRIRAQDLSRRVDVPDTQDEVAELAATVNATLERLEDAVARHRRFVSDASHELRTPITGLLVRLEAGLADPNEDEWRAAIKDAERLSDIVHDLLLMARLDAGVQPEQERIELGKLVEEEVSRQSCRLPLTMDVEPGLYVRGNRLRLARLLTNLLSNADRYGNSRVWISVRGWADQAVVEVLDDGPGIPEEMRDRVFERFTRLDHTRSRDTGGTGLGLPIARDIAKAHGGTLEIGAGPGARMILRLPKSPPAPDATRL
ncbi:sensor histidine kinase [Nonomuraea jabiensis]|uniref:sensor histidine kinase n=1 Tax=Nonomuraea jabiensis TaxID=882448 RepID=UPI0036B56647